MNIYVCNITDLFDLPGSELLTNTRRTRMLRYIQHEDKARCLAAGLMLRRVLGTQQAQRIADKTAFFLLGELVEFDDTQKMFHMPRDKRTEDYITGRFG